MTPVALAVLVAAGLGPLVLRIAARTMDGPTSLSSWEVTGVVTATGLVLGRAAARPVEDLAMLLPFAALGCAAAVVDAREGRLPDHLTGPMLAAALVASLGTSRPGAVLLTAAVASGVVLAIKAVAPAAIGWGDIKLAPSIAVVLAHHNAIARGLVTISLLLVATVLVVGLRRDTTTLIPYGPAMVFGTVAAAAF